jgi:glutamate:GABA antiporter
VPVIGIGLIVASISGLLDWLTGPSTGLLDIGRERGFLPPFFQQVNSKGVQVRILATQGAVITLIGLLYALVPSVSRAYWIFAALATEVYLIMYVLMFVAAVNLRRRQPDHPRGYRVRGLVTICVVGTLSSLGACLIGLLPPSQLGHANVPLYALALLAAVLVIGVLPPVLLLRLRKPAWKTSAAGLDSAAE